MIGPLDALRTRAERTAAGRTRPPIAVTGPRDLVAIARPEGGTRVSWQILRARDEMPAATS